MVEVSEPWWATLRTVLARSARSLTSSHSVSTHDIGSQQKAHPAVSELQHDAVVIYIQFAILCRILRRIQHLHSNTVTHINLLPGAGDGALDPFFLNNLNHSSYNGDE